MILKDKNILKKLRKLEEDPENLPREFWEAIYDAFVNQRNHGFYSVDVDLGDGLKLTGISIHDCQSLDREGLCHRITGSFLISGADFNFDISLVDGPPIIHNFELDGDSVEVIIEHKCRCEWDLIMRSGCKCGGI